MQTPPLMARLLHPSWLHHFLWSPPQMHPSWLQQHLTSFAPCVTKTPPLMTCWYIRRDCTVSLIALCVMHAPPNWILLEHPSKLQFFTSTLAPAYFPCCSMSDTKSSLYDLGLVPPSKLHRLDFSLSLTHGWDYLMTDFSFTACIFLLLSYSEES